MERPHILIQANRPVAYSSSSIQTVLVREKRAGEHDLSDPNTCLLFFKYYDPDLVEDLRLCYVGSLIVDARDPVFNILPKLRTMAGLPGMLPFDLYEDIEMKPNGDEFTHVLRRDRQTFEEVGFCTGDIVVFQKMGETLSYSTVAPKLPIFVNPVPKPDPPCVDGGFQPFFNEILETGNMSDVTVKVGARVFPGHKIVLSRLPYFQEKFVSAAPEQQKHRHVSVSPVPLVFELENVDEKSFALVLRYVYTGLFEAGATLHIPDLFQVQTAWAPANSLTAVSSC